MSALDNGLTFIRTASQRASKLNGWLAQGFKELMPKGLYARALLIIIVPMVILQSVVAFVFMERHWNTVTRRLSAAVVQDIASLIDVYKAYPQDKDKTQLRKIAAAARPRGGFSPGQRHAGAGTETVLLAARPDVVGATQPPDRAPVLDRHGRQIVHRRDSHQA